MTRCWPGFLMLLLPLSAAAQSVQGTVRDEDRGRALAGARLTLLRGDVPVDSTTTDGTGHYHLRAPGEGSYTIYFQLDGWASSVSNVVKVPAAGTTEFEVRVPLIASDALRQMSDIMRLEPRLQQDLPKLCGEPFRPWEAGLLIGVVRNRAGNVAVPHARVTVSGTNRGTIASDRGVYVLCNVPAGTAVRVVAEAPDGTSEVTEVEIRAGTVSWYDLELGARRRNR